MDKDELKFAEALINAHFERIIGWVVGDIKKCCRMRQDGTCDDSGALVGSFILWCYALDYFGYLPTTLLEVEQKAELRFSLLNRSIL